LGWPSNRKKDSRHFNVKKTDVKVKNEKLQEKSKGGSGKSGLSKARRDPFFESLQKEKKKGGDTMRFLK